MKTFMSMLPTAFSVLALVQGTSAFWGQIRVDVKCSEGCNPVLGLRDYNTGSTYSCGVVYPDSCPANKHCRVYCYGSGGYNFYGEFWKTSDGCVNFDFQGALDAHHGWCCGGMPCDIGA